MANSEKMGFFRFLGSIYFAAILIGLLAVCLTISTWLESTYGTPFAQRLVYQAGWFDAFLLLLAVNILFSTLSRWPFKKKHTGFVMTHVGILLLLAGSLASRLIGVDGQILLPEGHGHDRILLNEYVLAVENEHGEVQNELPIAKKGSKSFVDLPGTKAKVLIHRIADEAEAGIDVTEGNADDTANPAFHVVLKSQAMGANLDAWVMRRHPFLADPHIASAGPAKIQILNARPLQESKSPVLHVKKDGQTLLHWQPGEPPPTSLMLSGNPVTITNFAYFPEAHVGEGGKMQTSSQNPVNPAVEFFVEDEKGAKKRYLKFAKFPEFESMHGRADKDPFQLEVLFEGGEAKIAGPSLVFFEENGIWMYESRNRAGELKSHGKVETGKAQSAGWVDFEFVIDKQMARAVVTRIIKPKTGGQDGPALEITLQEGNHILRNEWVLAQEALTVSLPSGPLRLGLRQKSTGIPFSLQLLDFRKVDYPGTNRPASFESDVQLSDPHEKVEIKKTIRMNEPLDYAGYRIFQSSFIQSDGQEASIFTVAKNPGIFWIYFGSIVIFTGVFITFFVPPLSSFRH